MVRQPAWSPCQELALLSRHFHGHISEGLRFGVVPGEETLTDVGMLSLRRRRVGFTSFRGRLPVASSLTVHKFTLAQEGRTGADWNLFIRQGRRRLNFRLQSKRLYASGSYTKADPAQNQRLVTLSDRQGAIPLFALYNGPPASIRSACNVPNDQRLGCTVVCAERVLTPTFRRSVPWTPRGLGVLSIPLQCLFECQCRGSGTLDGGPIPGAGGPDVLLTVKSALLGPDPDSALAERLLAGLDLRPLPDRVEGALQALGDGSPGSLDELIGDDFFEGVGTVVLVRSSAPPGAA